MNTTNSYTATPGLFGIRHNNPIQNNNEKINEYLYKRGDKHFSSITRYNTSYLTINSRFRQKEPIYNSLNYIKLPKNPLKIEYGNNKLYIQTDNLLNLNPNDKIALIGLANITKKLRVNNGFFEFNNNSQFVKINFKSGLFFNSVDDAKNYKTTDLFIQISGFNSQINNIPINMLNNTHQIYLYNPTTNTYNNNCFYIKLNKPFLGTYVHTQDFNIKIEFLYSYGIPNNKINSVDTQNILTVSNVNDNNITVKYFKNMYFDHNEFGTSKLKFGGNNMSIVKITEITTGYPNPTQYNIDLDKIYNNVIMMKLISSEFPIIDKIITNNNNKLYWQTLDDGDNIYSISIDPGNYSISDIINIIENKTNNIKISYTPGNNEIKFSSLREQYLIQPIINISTNNIDNEIHTIITIKHNNHGFNINDKIIIQNMIDTDSITAMDLNNEHIINNIIDENTYEFTLKNINFNGNSSITKGGNNVKIISNNYFRFRFDFNDTIGHVFGFRNLGNTNSITKYSKIISNKDSYYNEFNNKIINTTDLHNSDYVLMVCKSNNIQHNIINQINNNSKVKNIFAKIRVYKNNNNTNINYIYDSFVDAPIYFHNPIPQLKNLLFEFYDKDGNLLEYDDFEHSFTLEITTLYEIPNGTHFSSIYPKVN